MSFEGPYKAITAPYDGIGYILVGPGLDTQSVTDRAALESLVTMLNIAFYHGKLEAYENNNS